MRGGGADRAGGGVGLADDLGTPIAAPTKAESAVAKTPVKSVAIGGIIAFAIHVAGAGMTYCSQLLIARIVGAESFGIYAYVLAWMVVLAYFCALGFDVALLRYVPAYRAEQSFALMKGVIQYAERRAAAIGIIVVAIGTMVVLLCSSEMSPALRNTFLSGLLLVPVWALLWIRSAVVRAFGGVASALMPDRMLRDGLLVAIVGIATFGLGFHIDAPWVMTATLVSSFIGLCLASLFARRLRPRFIDDVAASYAARIWRQTALPLVIIAATETLLNRTGVLLLGWSGHTTEAGIYGLAFNVAFLTALPRAAINTLFVPTISDLFVRQERSMLQALVSQAAAWTLCGAAGMAVVLFVLAPPLLSWFGQAYVAGVPAMRILLIGQVFAAAAGSQLQIMTMTGHERSAALLLVASALVNAGLGAVLITIIGLTGAAIAATAALIGWNIAMAIFISRHLQLRPGILGLRREPAERRLWQST